jgi:hypothetical protein
LRSPCADRFIRPAATQRWQKLDQTRQSHHEAGDMAGYKATRSAMGNMARSLEQAFQTDPVTHKGTDRTVSAVRR